jgi:hypothetical protein
MRWLAKPLCRERGNALGCRDRSAFPATPDIVLDRLKKYRIGLMAATTS